jgi:hypothetical protein
LLAVGRYQAAVLAGGFAQLIFKNALAVGGLAQFDVLLGNLLSQFVVGGADGDKPLL